MYFAKGACELTCVRLDACYMLTREEVAAIVRIRTYVCVCVCVCVCLSVCVSVPLCLRVRVFLCV